jgi:hypothetical protein
MLSTRTTIASRPARPLSLFTIAFPPNVTSVEHGLVRLSCLSAIFTMPKNSVGSELIYFVPFFLELLLSVRGCYPRCACLTHAWSVLSLLPAHELPSSHPGLLQWLRKIRVLPLWGVDGLRLNSRIRLLLMIRSSPRRRLLLSKMLHLLKRICLEIRATAGTPPTVVVM